MSFINSPPPMSFKDDRNTPLLAGESVTEFGGDTNKKNGKGSLRKSVVIQDHNENLRMAPPQENPQGDGSVNISKLGPAIDLDDIENNTDKSIDFNSQLEALKKRTETELPHTLTQVEDIMFLDQYSVIALEYHYYQNESKYYNLKPCNEHIDEEGVLVDEHGQKVTHPLGTDKYQLKEGDIHPMSSFDRKDIMHYHEDNKEILRNQKSMDDPTFVRYDNQYIPLQRSKSEIMQVLKKKLASRKLSSKAKGEPKMFEAIIAIYKVTPLGGLQRTNQVSCPMGRKFVSSIHGNMVLQRSKDKKVVSITNFDAASPTGEYFKSLAWTNKLKKFETPDAFTSLNNGMNAYFDKVHRKFDELIEVSFVGNSKFVQLIYLEATERSLQEQQQFEQQIAKKRIEDGIPPASQTDTFAARNSPRKARKYVFFDSFSGNIVFEYGGVQSPFTANRPDGEETDIYELGVLVKEIREEAFNPQLVFFFCGDFMDPQIKEQQFMFQWAAQTVLIGMRQLFELETQEEKMDLIQTNIKSVIAQNQKEGHLNYYPFDKSWILNNMFNWEHNITCSANRKFNEYALLNAPVDSINTYWVHGPKYKDLVKLSTLKTNNYLLDVAYYSKLPSDSLVRHTRNSNMKDQLFFDVIKNNEVKTYCLRLDHPDPKNKVISVQIPVHNHVGQNDIWLQFKKNVKTNQVEDLFQTIEISHGDQCGVLKTKLPRSFRTLQEGTDLVVRKTNMFYKYVADFPCICYNLGDSKIILQNTLQIEQKKNYILNLEPDEKFLCFLEFNQFEDLGFYPKGLRIECCSHFAFLTTGKGENAGNLQKNRINLVLMDPFYENTQVSHFRSNCFFESELQSQGDCIITSIVQSTMGKKRDSKFKTYIWTQFPDQLVRSSLLKITNGAFDAQDTDEDDGNSGKEDDADILGKMTYQPIKLVMNDRDFMYYVTQKNGQCYIIEGNPRDQYIDNHQVIYQLKAEKCLAFSVEGCDVFFFMDETFVVHKLSRNKNNRMLTSEKELTMKEIQRLDFKPQAYEEVILNEKYIIQGNRIFYLYDNLGDPFPEGVFESENLIPDDKSQSRYDFHKGGYILKGSHRFFNVYQQDKFTSKIKIFQKPDQTEKLLINDFLNWVDMSTFLENGKILVKIRRRFMIFTGDGNFIAETEFNDDILASQPQSQKQKLPMDYQKFKEKSTHQHAPSKEATNILLLERRRAKNPILDFSGNRYQFETPSPPPALSDSNKMELLNFSQNNMFYLFLNRMSEQLCVYELCEVLMARDESFMSQNVSKKVGYQFVLRSILDYDSSQLFQHFYSINVDPICHFRTHMDQVQIDDHGCVKLAYVEDLPFVEKQNETDESVQDLSEEVVQCRLIGSIFSPIKDSIEMTCESFTQVFDFPRDAQLKVQQSIENQKANLDMKINQIRAAQSRLPKKLFDYSEYENLIDELLVLESKSNTQVSAGIYGEHNLVVIHGGQYVKFGKLIPNKKKIRGKKDLPDLIFSKVDGKQIRDMNAYFGDSIEVIKIIETINKNWLQIKVEDHEEGITTVVTWDFDNNMEQSIMQITQNPKDLVGYHVVKGMIAKRNYMLSQNYLTDLEHNIPLRQKNVNQNLEKSRSYMKQLEMIVQFYNQRKVYEDNSKILGVEKAYCLFYPLNRMDLLMWENMNFLGEKAELIQKACSIEQFNIVVDGISLFHYFADNSDIIEQIHDRYNDNKQNGTLEGTDATLPLQILNPDNDGRTALFLAVASQSPSSFECMVDMLKDFPDICITKMMLKSLALIVSNESSQVIDFFEQNIFQPPQMQIDQFIPWGDDMEEFIFPSHTSIISKQLLYEKLMEEGVVSEPYSARKKKISSKDEEEDGVQMSKRQKTMLFKKNLRSTALQEKFDAGLAEGEQPLKRVQVEALDLDWIFTGDNAKTLLKILASDANNAALTKKTIKIFVDLMWSKYQQAIIRYIFVPYAAYLVCLSQLAGSVAGEFTDILYEDLEDQEIYQKYQILKIKAYVLTALSTSLMIVFASLEVGQFLGSGIGYFADYWNCIDSCSISINAIFLIMTTINCIRENEHFPAAQVRTYGSFAAFFMWIKVFYWMRLFSSLAYYVKLIQQTISDSMNFMLMVFLIILSFANFFYVIDRNLVTLGAPGERYYDQYLSTPEINHDIIDVTISVYMMGALGDFDSTRYRTGYDRYFSMVMFLLATFIICVVFMNMLIAIMGETFGQVLEVSEESGLREQVVLIEDHSWLLDPRKIFKGQKYIIKVMPSTSNAESDDIVMDNIKETELTVVKKINRLQGFIQKRVESVDNNTRFLLKYQQLSIEGLQRRIKMLETMFKSSQETEPEEFQGLTEDEKLLLAEQKKKKAEILKMLNSQTSGQTLTIEKVQDVALNWMELADKDGNGELDFNEFFEFFSKIEDVVLSEGEIKQIFEDFDGSGNGFLSVEEFARAIYQAVLADHDEYSDDYGIEDQDR